MIAVLTAQSCLRSQATLVKGRGKILCVNVTARAARGLVGAGLVGCLVWSVTVEAAMPSWFDPDDSCPGVSLVAKSYFPPRATCVYEDGAVEYIPLAKTVILTVLLVFLAAVLVTGLAVLGWQVLRSARSDARPGRPVRHVLGAAVLGVVTGEVARAAVVIALLGGPPGAATALLAVLLLAVGAANALDRAVGPGRGGSPRRATAVVAAGAAAVLVAATGTPLGPGWATAVGAVVFAVVAAAQWFTLPGGSVPRVPVPAVVAGRK